MQIKFEPIFLISTKIKNDLEQIDLIKKNIEEQKIEPNVLNSLRETMRLRSTHYSTMIEGNKLTQKQVDYVAKVKEYYPEHKRNEYEVKGYYTALCELEKFVSQKVLVTEKIIQILHAIVEGGGKTDVKPTPYRDGQNIIKDMVTGRIVYMPPEAKDVPDLMFALVSLIQDKKIPVPIIAGIAHYQFVTIHPYYDGNGRTARLLTNLILDLGGYGLKGIYSLDEYYARDLGNYYEALTVGPSHNYYMGRAEADITNWLEYFCNGIVESFNKAQLKTQESIVK